MNPISFSSTGSPQHRRRRRLHVRTACVVFGFTLLEMLVIVTLLAAVAGVAWSAYAGLENRERDQLAHVQVDRLAQAVRQFKADTGYWPGQGPFALAPAGNTETLQPDGSVRCSDTSAGLWLRSTLDLIDIPLVVPPTVIDVDAWHQTWFEHPANLWMLVTAPKLCANHPLGRLQGWNAAAGRGWRGPYLEPGKLGWVDVTDGLSQQGTGNPTIGLLQHNLRGLAAGRNFAPAGLNYTDCLHATSDCAFRWHPRSSQSTGYDPARESFSNYPRPLLYFGPASGRPRIGHAGPDGRFGGLDSPSTCDASSLATGGADDTVTCLD